MPNKNAKENRSALSLMVCFQKSLLSSHHALSVDRKKRTASAVLFVQINERSQREVHVVFDRGDFNPAAGHFLHLQINVSIDPRIREHATFG